MVNWSAVTCLAGFFLAGTLVFGLVAWKIAQFLAPIMESTPQDPFDWERWNG